jgi:pre-mRNA-splicing factor ISY1
MACYNLPTTNYTSGDMQFLPNIKDIFNNPPKVNNIRCKYDIYKKIDAIYYGYMDDEHGILEKV